MTKSLIPQVVSEIFWDAIANIVFLLGIVVIEVFIRPLFGKDGIPILVEIVLTIGDLTFILSMLVRLVFMATKLSKEILKFRKALKP